MPKIKNIREQFPYLNKNKKTIYFDNGATTLKPETVIKAESDYLTYIAANPHSVDYESAFEANEVLLKTRKLVKEFINADNEKEVIFTSGATESLNQVAFGIEDLISENDEILITNLEHSSELLPWVIVAKKKKAIIKEIPLNNDLSIDVDKLMKMINKKTKVVTFSTVSNTIGAWNDSQAIIKAIRKKNPKVIVAVDAAQSIGHIKTDVKNWDVDFLSFSAHKMYGPFGVGVLYGKEEYLEQLTPFKYGGGMSASINLKELSYEPEPIPARLEAGTPNISGIYAFAKAIEFINDLGIDKIHEYETGLKEYAKRAILTNELEKEFDFYNLENDSPIILFNAKGLNPQDIATYLANDYDIDVRSGAHCARLTDEVIKTKITIRASLAVYNTTKEIDTLVEALKNSDHFLDHLFK
ncbi:Cysteine desulfurase SufS [Mesoplasma lactucae ATCC 49193]|uniref:cysteine desulfurase n=2 Tax=Mesoplasma lactucae TaxID=138853 RepID=A0A291IRZ0_9MOLU|nr:aminotransferase class V-fold PLP-dependent enzyme [Mesoplasma lactucae]ATG97514.1 aminotransferase [Mesoplasma lactucae ATCC 49193]ATZ20030.1 cysteine desulfurase [Mesoplasma lactucae ATCC 49193]MCL8217019.1 Cysteine desulfurase SufS [Mesoplasma lactucae ATCC 49193]